MGTADGRPRAGEPGDRLLPKPHEPTGLPAAAALRIACGREGLARARAFTRDTLCGWSLGHRSDDAVLVVTELASNAVTHAVPRTAADGTGIGLLIALHPGRLTLSVSDPADAPPVYAPPDASALEEHGRGLRIVDALSEEWGWAPRRPAGKTVWARLSTRPPT
ncbi:ATP-binding protein [Streptomyces glaucus]|uniref:ATP-binding protein n=1 Tax=Streptomyces glaucus TaxID=284029 RepID=UPI003CD06D6B